jgi:hypothetical protein
MKSTACLSACAAAALIAAAPASARSGRHGPSLPPVGYGTPPSASQASSGRPDRFRHMPPGRMRFDGRRRFDRLAREGFFFGGLGYGGLVEDPESLRDQGFFAGPAEVQVANGGAYYDYDRAYPYDWYRDPEAAAAQAAPRMAAAPVMRCDVAWVSGRGAAASPVRVCRGRR